MGVRDFYSRNKSYIFELFRFIADYSNHMPQAFKCITVC